MKSHPKISNELAGKLKESGRYIIENWQEKNGEAGKAILDQFESKRKAL